MDRFCEEPGHRCDVDLGDTLTGRERDGISHHELAKRRGLDALNGPAREYGMDHTGFHRASAALEHEARRFYEGSAAGYLVIHDQGDFPVDITNQIHRARDLVVSGAPLVHNRDGAR